MCPEIVDGDGLSNTRVDRVGRRLRAWFERESPELVDTDDELRQALWDLFAWRDTFRSPLSKVVMGLRSFVRSERPELRAPATRLPVGQRLKREPQIIRKLSRYPTMRLSRMQDVGGCRAIMPGGASEVAAVLARIQRRWDVLDVQDYVERPQETGYRAIHVVVRRDERLIEIQLRTPLQHEWAGAVERTGLRLRMPLKEGGGDPALLRYFALAADGMALEESGELPGAGFTAEFAEARDRVRHFFRRPS
jgi:putative GTP pyrophosphokinase